MSRWIPVCSPVGKRAAIRTPATTWPRVGQSSRNPRNPRPSSRGILLIPNRASLYCSKQSHTTRNVAEICFVQKKTRQPLPLAFFFLAFSPNPSPRISGVSAGGVVSLWVARAILGSRASSTPAERIIAHFGDGQGQGRQACRRGKVAKGAHYRQQASRRVHGDQGDPHPKRGFRLV